MVDLRVVRGEDMPGAVPVLQGGELLPEDGLVHQQHGIAFTIAYIRGFPDGDHHFLRRIIIFKSLQDGTGNRAEPGHLPDRHFQDLLRHFLRKRIIFRIIQKNIRFRHDSEQASVLPHAQDAVDAFIAPDLAAHIVPAIKSGVDQVLHRAELQSGIGCHPVIRQGALYGLDGAVDQRGQRIADRLETGFVHALLLLQDHGCIGPGEQDGQQCDHERGHGDHRQEHTDLK